MKKGDLIRLVTRKRRTSDPKVHAGFSHMEYPLSKEEQEIGLVIQEGDEYVKQMHVLSNRIVKYWFIHHCELINEYR